jgi:hypothetical protein
VNSQETSSWRKNARKVAIVLILIGSLLPALTMNIGMYAHQAGLSGPIIELDRPHPAFHALLLCQVWGLFAYISPFNYTLNYEVELTNGETLALHDLKKDRAGKWQSILFHNEAKSDNNFYSDRNAMRQYMEYLIRTNDLDPSWIVRRTIYLRYRNVFPRDQAAAAGIYYGPETTSVIESY